MKGFLQKLGVLTKDDNEVIAAAAAPQATPPSTTVLYEDDTVIIGGTRAGSLPKGLMAAMKEAEVAATPSNLQVTSPEREARYEELKEKFSTAFSEVAHKSPGAEPLVKFTEAFLKLEAVTDPSARYKAALSVSGLLPTDVIKAAKDYPDIISFISSTQDEQIEAAFSPKLKEAADQISSLQAQKQKLSEEMVKLESKIDEWRDHADDLQDDLAINHLAVKKSKEAILAEFSTIGESIVRYLTPALDSLNPSDKKA